MSEEVALTLNSSCLMAREACNQMLYQASKLKHLRAFHFIEVSCSDLEMGCESSIFEVNKIRQKAEAEETGKFM
jgi:hypothetical protein